MLKKTFLAWQKETENYINNLKEQVVHQVAVEQIGRQTITPVQQTIFDATSSDLNLIKLEKHGFLSMKKSGDSPGTYYVPLKESQIQNLCQTTHSYVKGSTEMPLRFLRTTAFVDRENLFAYMIGSGRLWDAKDLFVPHLSFPFLPYSRKFVTIFIDDQSSEQANFPLDLDNIRLNGPLGNHSAFKKLFNSSIIPIWNIKEVDTEIGFYVKEGKNKGEHCHYLPKEEALHDSDPNASIYFHGIKEKDEPEWSTRAYFDKIHIDDHLIECLISTEPFNKIRTSQVFRLTNRQIFKEHINTWISGESSQVYPKDLYWFRQFIMSFTLSESDIIKLITMIPFYQNAIRLTTISTTDISKDKLAQPDAANHKYTDYLWYLGSSSFAKNEDFKTETTTLITLEFKSRESSDIPEFLHEDVANYIASLCSLYLPFGFNCQAVVL